MKDFNEKKVDDMCHKEKAGYWRGQYDALKEKTHNTGGKISSIGGMLKQSFIDHIVRYVVIGFFSVSLIYGSVWYISKKTEEVVDSVKTEFKETVTSVKTDFKDAIDIHPYDATKEWLNNGEHWWSDKNETNETEVDNIILSKDVVIKTEIVDVKPTKEIVIKTTEKIEIEVTKIEDNRTITQKVKGKWSSWFSKKKENNESKE